MSSPIKPSSPLPAKATAPTAIPVPAPQQSLLAQASLMSSRVTHVTERPTLDLARQTIAKGQKAQEEGRYEDAIASYCKLIDLKTGNTSWEKSALRNRMWCHAKLSKWTEVVADCNGILRLEASSPNVDIVAKYRNARAEANWYLKKWDLAILDSTKVTQMMANEPFPAGNYIAFAYWIRGLALASQEHWEHATLDYTKVLELSQEAAPAPLVERARLFRALAYAKHHEEEKARKELESVDFESAGKNVHPAFDPTLRGALAEARALLARDRTSPSAPTSSAAALSPTSPSKKRPADDASTQDTSRRRTDESASSWHP